MTDAFSLRGNTEEVDWGSGEVIMSLFSVTLSLRFLRNEIGSWRSESVTKERELSQKPFKHRRHLKFQYLVETICSLELHVYEK